MVTSQTVGEMARSVLASPPPELGTGWPLAVCLLGRQSLEESLDEFWSCISAAMINTPTSTKLICAPMYGEGLGDLFSLWSRLSEWCHYRAVWAEPSAGELEALLTDVERSTDLLRVSSGRQSGLTAGSASTDIAD